MRKKMASQMVALVTVRRKAWAIPCSVNSTWPICAIPLFNSKSPTFAHTTMAKTITSVLIRSLLSLGILGKLIVSGSGTRTGYGDHGLVVVLAAFARPLQALCAKLQEFRRFRVQPFAFMGVPQSVFDDAPDDSRTEIVLIVEAVHAAHHFRFRKMRILNMGKLVAAGIRKRFNLKESLRRHAVVKLGTGHGMRQGDLNGFAIQFLGEVDGLLNGLSRLAGQSDDEVAVHPDSIFAAMLAEVSRHLQRCALFDVLQDLCVTRFESHDEQTRPGLGHRPDR